MSFVILLTFPLCHFAPFQLSRSEMAGQKCFLRHRESYNDVFKFALYKTLLWPSVDLNVLCITIVLKIIMTVIVSALIYFFRHFWGRKGCFAFPMCYKTKRDSFKLSGPFC